MLGKLFKYEIKATSRIFLPLYALLIIFAFVNKFFMAVNAAYFEIPRVIAMTVFVFIIIGICIMTLVVTIQRFNKNLLTDEGYLSFTLPVKVHSHIDCKMLVTLLWTVISAIVSVVAIFIMTIDQKTIVEFQRFMREFINAMNQFGVSGYVILFELILFAVVLILSSTVSIYAAITIGNMSSKHKILAGMGAYLGFCVIEQIVTSILMTSFGGSWLNSLRLSTIQASHVQMIRATELTLLGMTVYTLIFGAAYYFLTEWMLRKKLNLE